EALIRAEVQVALRAIIEHKRLAMPIRIERTSVEVEIAVDLDRRDGKTQKLQQVRQRCRKNAFADTRHDTACDNNVFGASHAIVGGEEVKVFGVVGPHTQFFTINVFHSDILVKTEVLYNPCTRVLLQLAFNTLMVPLTHPESKEKSHLRRGLLAGYG